MNQKKGHQIIIIILIIFIPLLVVAGIGFYKVKNIDAIIEENPEPEKVEQIIEKPSPNKNKKPKPLVVEEIIPEEPGDPDFQDAREEVNNNEDLEDGLLIEEEIILPIMEKKEPGAVYIAHCKSLFRKDNEQDYSFVNNSRLQLNEWEQLQINQIRGGVDFRNVAVDHLVKGKVYYNGDNGKLESFIYLNPNGKMHEYLIALDPEGKYVNSLEIGLITPGSDARKYATISINKLSIFDLDSSKEIKREERVTEYFIDPYLHFKKGKTFTKLK